MQQIGNGYQGLSVLFSLNCDRIIYLTTLALALLAGAFVGSFF